MKFLLIDDHALIREALRGVVRELRDDADVLEAGTSRQAMDLIQAHGDLALILLDVQLPDRNGLEMLTELRARFPAIAVVMLSASNDRDTITTALDTGAVGFIPKTAAREILLGALRLILAGGTYIPPDILAATPAPAVPTGPPARAGQRPTAAELGLTERQLEVLALMMQGKNNKLICRALDLAEPTVKNHVSAVLKALNASNRTEAVLAVAALGWELPKSAG